MSYFSSFITYLDLDFTALPTQTISSDGAVTVAGMSWIKGNSSNDATAMAITNGSGLVIKPGSTSDYNGTTRTLPYLWLAFNQIPGINTLNWQSRIRVWIDIASENSTTTYDGTVIAVDNNSTTFTYTVKRGFGTNGQGCQGQCVVSPNNGFVGSTFTLGQGNRVLMLDIDLNRSSFSMMCGSNATVWPDPDSMSLMANQTIAGTSFSANGIGGPYSTLGVMLGSQRAGSGTSLSITIARLRIDIMQ